MIWDLSWDDQRRPSASFKRWGNCHMQRGCSHAKGRKMSGRRDRFKQLCSWISDIAGVKSVLFKNIEAFHSSVLNSCSEILYYSAVSSLGGGGIPPGRKISMYQWHVITKSKVQSDKWEYFLECRGYSWSQGGIKVWECIKERNQLWRFRNTNKFSFWNLWVCNSIITLSLTSPSLIDLKMPFSEHLYSQTEWLLSYLYIPRLYTIT